jgi:GNAT superfamily N-acetyltransferase
MPSATFRTRTEADIPALVAALEDVYSTDSYPIEGTADAAAFLTPRGLLQAWVAVHAGVVVGQIVVVAGAQGHPAAVQAWVDLPDSGGDAARTIVAARFFICKHARGQGLGRALIQRTCDWANANGMKIVMNVLSKDKEAMRLYEKVGFRRIGEGTYEYDEGKMSLQYFYVYR